MEHKTLMSVPWMIGIYVVLMILLILTVIAAWFPLGAGTLIISLAIAAAKAALVVLYFMHVRFASKVTYLFVGAGVLWLSIMFTLTFSEYLGRTQISRTFPAWTQQVSGGRIESPARHATPPTSGF